jgi:flagellar basal body-associated protein FliL
MEAEGLGQVVVDNLHAIDETFLAVLNMNIEAAQRAKRPDIVERMTRIHDAIMRLMQEAAPPEVRWINELLQMESDSAALEALKQRSAEINQELIDTMAYIGQSLRQSGQEQMAERLEMLRSQAVGEKMKANWKK